MKTIRRIFLVFLVLVMLTGCQGAAAKVVDMNLSRIAYAVIPLDDSIIYHYEPLSTLSGEKAPLELERLYFDGRVEKLEGIQVPNIRMQATIGDLAFFGTYTFDEVNKRLYILDLPSNQMTVEDLGDDDLMGLEAFGEYLIRSRYSEDAEKSSYLEMYDPKTATVIKTFDIYSSAPRTLHLADLSADREYLYALLTQNSSDDDAQSIVLKLNRDLEAVGTVDISSATSLVSNSVYRLEVYDDFIYLGFDGNVNRVTGTLENDVLVDPEMIRSVFPLLQCDSSSPVFSISEFKELFFIDEKTNKLVGKEIPMTEGYGIPLVQKWGDKIIIFAFPTTKETAKKGQKCYITDRSLSGIPE